MPHSNAEVEYSPYFGGTVVSIYIESYVCRKNRELTCWRPFMVLFHLTMKVTKVMKVDSISSISNNDLDQISDDSDEWSNEEGMPY